MAQLTVYLDDQTEKRVKKAARLAKVSVSRWVTTVLRDKTETTWPQAVLDLAGAWPDFPTAGQLRRSQPRDIPREDI
jgi:hypothetical protein